MVPGRCSPVLAGLMTTVTASTFMMLFTATTIAFTAAGTGASAPWFLAVLRKAGLRLRFAPARAWSRREWSGPG
jgi:hypothetical protein